MDKINVKIEDYMTLVSELRKHPY